MLEDKHQQLTERLRLEGHSESYIKGFIEGYIEGSKTVTQEVTHKLIVLDIISDEQIATVTGLSLDEIEAIRQGINQ